MTFEQIGEILHTEGRWALAQAVQRGRVALQPPEHLSHLAQLGWSAVHTSLVGLGLLELADGGWLRPTAEGVRVSLGLYDQERAERLNRWAVRAEVRS